MNVIKGTALPNLTTATLFLAEIKVRFKKRHRHKSFKCVLILTQTSPHIFQQFQAHKRTDQGGEYATFGARHIRRIFDDNDLIFKKNSQN